MGLQHGRTSFGTRMRSTAQLRNASVLYPLRRIGMSGCISRATVVQRASLSSWVANSIYYDAMWQSGVYNHAAKPGHKLFLDFDETNVRPTKPVVAMYIHEYLTFTTPYFSDILEHQAVMFDVEAVDVDQLACMAPKGQGTVLSSGSKLARSPLSVSRGVRNIMVEACAGASYYSQDVV